MKNPKVFLLMVFSLFFFSQIARAAVDVPTLFQEANTAYKARDFKTAAQGYEKLLEEGERKSSVYYNLGNTYFRLGQKGKALVAYERALEANPRDADARRNIGLLKTTLLDRLNSEEGSRVIRWLGIVYKWAAVDEVSILLTCVLGFFAFLSLMALVAARWRGFLRTAQFLSLIVLAVLGFILFFGIWQAKDPKMVILNKEVYALYGPSTQETKAFLLHEGAEGRVVDSVKDWYYVTVENKNFGWIPKDACELI